MTSALTKYLYVLACPGRGRLATMAHLSVRALLRLYPEARTILLCDRDTQAALLADFPGFLESFKEVVAVPLDYASYRMRGLWLKTRMRSLVRGDFVYLDIDTLPVRRFDDIVQGPWDIAAVQDRNHHCPVVPSYPHWRKADYDKLGWAYPLPKYFNTGVMFLRDNAATQRLTEEWQGHWRHFYEVCNDFDDQFPFNSALHKVSVNVRELDTTYNAMAPVHPAHAREAKIYHFLVGNQKKPTDTLFDYLTGHYETTCQIDWKAVDQCVAMNHPWMPPYWPRRLWQTRNYWRALGLILRHMPGKLFRAFHAENKANPSAEIPCAKSVQGPSNPVLPRDPRS